MRNCEATRPDLGGSNDVGIICQRSCLEAPLVFRRKATNDDLASCRPFFQRNQMEKSSTSWAMFHSYVKSPEGTISYVNQNLIVSGCEVTGGEHRHVG